MRRRVLSAALAAGLVALSVPPAAVTAPAHAGDETLARGEYLSKIMDCGGCHTPGMFAGKPDMARHLAGGEVGFQIPGLGTFYPPNLTSDAETGLGGWTAEQIVAAVRGGVRPDGRMLAPAMPYHSYSALSDDDAAALAAYLKSLPAVAQKVPGPFGDGAAPSAPYFTVAVPGQQARQ
jgi:mono/diheme cytochrome c family protein